VKLQKLKQRLHAIAPQLAVTTDKPVAVLILGTKYDDPDGAKRVWLTPTSLLIVTDDPDAAAKEFALRGGE
jgi:hypothetical protein